MSAAIDFLKHVEGEDFEFYPTTPEIINAVKSDIKRLYNYSCQNNYEEHLSYLDCGAGDGRVLNALADKGAKYAIEKSRALINKLDPDVFIVGTDLMAEPLFNKQAHITYSNPPYTAYAEWMQKIIKESTSQVLYFVVPKRWRTHKGIQQALKARNCIKSDLEMKLDRKDGFDGEVNKLIKVIGQFSFNTVQAERKARVEVDVIRIVLASVRGRSIINADQRYLRVDPMELAINELVSSLTPNVELHSGDESESTGSRQHHENALNEQSNPVANLVESYENEKADLFNLFKSLCSIRTDLLSSIGVNQKQVKDSIRCKITELSPQYWKRLFDFYKPINDRLCASKAKLIQEKISKNGGMEFTESNVYAVTSWTVKNAKINVDEQLCELFDKIASPDNVRNYKSNQRVFNANGNGWRSKHTNIHYLKRKWCEEYGEHIQLEYRLVVDGIGAGLSSSTHTHWEGRVGLNENTRNLFNDLTVCASNLGFDVHNNQSYLNQGEWEAGKAKVITFRDSFGKDQQLFKARVYGKGTVHIQLNQEFAIAMNVEVGRLKGWLHSSNEAIAELGITQEQSDRFYGANDNHGKAKLVSRESAQLLMLESKGE